MDNHVKDYLARYDRNLKREMFKTNKFYEASILIDLLNEIERSGLPLKAAYQAKRHRYDDGHERALLDLHFQQIDVTIECDEAYHKGNVEADKARVRDAGLKRVIRIDATEDEYTLRDKISNIVKELESLWIEAGKPMPEICDNSWSIAYLNSHDEIKASDGLFIGGDGNLKNVGLLNALGFKTSKGNPITVFRSSCYDVNDNLMIWMPRDTSELSSKKKNMSFKSEGIGKNETWNEYFEDRILEHINLRAKHKNRNKFIKKMKTFKGDLLRIVWRRNRNECGEEGLRYIGNYKFNGVTVNGKDAVMEWLKTGESFKKSELK